MVLVYRERAYCSLQLGDLAAVEESLGLIRDELARELSAEELPTRQDLHAIAATVALLRGDDATAATEADAAIKMTAQAGGTSSFPNMYWAIFLIARVFASLWLRSVPAGGDDRRLRRGLSDACRALSKQAWSHPIAGPSAAIAGGYLLNLRGRQQGAAKSWRRASAEATRLGMAYEAGLAAIALGESGEVAGLPFIIVQRRIDAG